jgi:hypothetical protein
MAELKTQKTNASVEAFLDSIDDDRRRDDCRAVAKLMRSITGAAPAMWGTSIVGFRSYQYHYASGRSAEWFVMGFSPRKRDLTLYLMGGFDDCDDLLSKLGKFKTGKCCLYLKRLEDVHLPTLKKLLERSQQRLAKPSR